MDVLKYPARLKDRGEKLSGGGGGGVSGPPCLSASR